MYTRTLRHHGILGQKWGIRRFQNKDGSLTAAGKKHSDTGSMSDEELTSKVKRLTLEKTYKKLSKEASPTSKLEKSKKVVDVASSLTKQAESMNRDSLNSRPKTKLDLSRMTDQELRDRINRTNLERQYNDMFAKKAPISKGRAFATNLLEGAGTALTIGSSALGIALAIKELRK